MAVTAEVLDRTQGIIVPTDSHRNGDGHNGYHTGTLSSCVIEVGPLDVKISSLRTLLENLSYPRLFQRPMQNLSLDQWKTHHLQTRAREASHTMIYVANGAAAEIGGRNSPEKIIEQYQRYLNHEPLTEKFGIWENQFKIMDQYLECLL